jgi:hypothetical protein
MLTVAVAVPLAATPAYAQPATGTISGTLTTAAGAPLADVGVTVHPTVPVDRPPVGVTDSAGRFSVAGLAPGDYKVEFYFEETLSSQWAHRARDEASATRFTVRAGETTIVDERRYPTGSLLLTVVDGGSGQPVTTFCAQALGDYFLRDGCTDTGTLLLTDLPEGWYLLHAGPAVFQAVWWAEGTVVADQVTAITLS